jgi:hypothetical protein
MKINQLFTKKVDLEVLHKLLSAFGLNGLNDKQLFSKFDLIQIGTLKKVELLKLELSNYYLPCKAKVYLENLTEKKIITILKQVLRLHGYYLQSREKNINTRKIIFYQIVSEVDKAQNQNMRRICVRNVIHFD